jgi:hypothetical protein
MKKGLIVSILMVLLVGTVVAQTPQAQAIPSQLMSAVSEMLENVIEINEKTCSDEPIVLAQQSHSGSEHSFFVMAPGSRNPFSRNFLPVFSEREGELVSIDRMSVYGLFHGNAPVGDTCELLLNDVLCGTYVKQTNTGDDEYFYDVLPTSCVDALELDELNELRMECPILSDSGIYIYRILYDATWKSC